MNGILLGAATAVLCLLTGCSAGRELESTALVRVLGVDGGGERITLTAASGVQDMGQKAPELFSAQGDGLADAITELKASGEDYVSCAHITQLVVGEGMELKALLMDGVADRETGYHATVWLADTGTAANLLEGADGGVGRLDSIEENAGVAIKDMLTALVELEREGEVTLPVLRLEGDTLTFAGYRAIKEGEHGGE